ncbi:MAG: hypothetical protein ACJ76Z_13255 [Thermoleophilaceae bacterium]
MSTGSEGQAAKSGYERPPGVHKAYIVPSPEAEAFMVEDAQWKRLRGRIDAIEKRPGLGWLLTVASSAFGVGASAFLALLVLPSATGPGAELSAGVKPSLMATGIASMVLCVVFVALYFVLRKNAKLDAVDICHEMDTIHASWKQREGEELQP